MRTRRKAPVIRIAVLLAPFAALLTAASLANGNDGVRSGVAALLRRSADAWNRGDLCLTWRGARAA